MPNNPTIPDPEEEPRDDAPEPPEFFSHMTSAEEDARGYSPAVFRSWTNR